MGYYLGEKGNLSIAVRRTEKKKVVKTTSKGIPRAVLYCPNLLVP